MIRYQIPGLLALLLLNVGSLPAASQHANCKSFWTNPQTKDWECLDRKFVISAAISPDKADTTELIVKDAKVVRTKSNRDLLEVVGKFKNQGSQDRFLYYAVVNLDYAGTPVQQLIVPVNTMVAAGKSVSFRRQIGKENLTDRDVNPALINATAIKYEYR